MIKVNTNIKLPTGFSFGWVGKFENQVRANYMLIETIPISIIGIFGLHFIVLCSSKDSLSAH